MERKDEVEEALLYRYTQRQLGAGRAGHAGQAGHAAHAGHAQTARSCSTGAARAQTQAHALRLGAGHAGHARALGT